DIDKNAFAWNGTSYIAYKNVSGDNAYDLNKALPGEGVYWYDLEQGVINNSFSFNSFLPAAFHGLVTDPQGRVLFATAGGLFRGTPLGFDYDFTANGEGIMGFTLQAAETPNPRGMEFNDLNANLQINDLTGAGIDPSDSNNDPSGPFRFYTSAVDVGTGVTNSGVNAWAPSGGAGLAANVPKAVSLVVASP